MAAYPTSYEFPYCPECKTLRGAVVNAQDCVRSFRPPDASKSRTRWPRIFQNEIYSLECHENLTKAKYQLHLFNAHADKRYESRVMENHAIVVRKGRLKP